VSDARNFEVDLLNCALMKRKTPISTTGRLKTPDNPARGRYRTGWLGDAARKVQQMSEAQFHGFLEENPDAIIIVDQTGRMRQTIFELGMASGIVMSAFSSNCHGTRREAQCFPAIY
jgi:hypothetical protein